MFNNRTLQRIEIVGMVVCRFSLQRRYLHFRLASFVYLFVVLVNGILQRHLSLLNRYASVDEALAVLECVVATLAAI